MGAEVLFGTRPSGGHLEYMLWSTKQSLSRRLQASKVSLEQYTCGTGRRDGQIDTNLTSQVDGLNAQENFCFSYAIF